MNVKDINTFYFILPGTYTKVEEGHVCIKERFYQSQLGQSIQALTENINVVSSSHTVGKKKIIFPLGSTEPIQIKSCMVFIRSNRCIERMII